jgi:hypothetical protein
VVDAQSSVASGVKLGFGMFCLLPVLLVTVPFVACAACGAGVSLMGIVRHHFADVGNPFGELLAWTAVIGGISLIGYWIYDTKR